jgi:putative SOS response-associated peptidase YedK
MCGRFVLKKRLADGLIQPLRWKDVYAFHAGLNLSPGSQIVVVPSLDKDATLATWGFPSPYGPQLIINARAETIHEKPTFRDAFKHRRCLVPADGWYEWQGKQPHYIHRRNDALMAFAGILQPGEIPRVAIITTAAAPELASIHDRMPAIIPEHMWAHWLNPAAPVNTLAAMLQPFDANLLEAYPVRKAGDLEPFTPERGLFD